MKTVTLDIKTVWAMTSTAVALVLLGLLVGKSIAETAPVSPLISGTEPGAPAETDTYAVPTWLIDAPMEWRSEVDQLAAGIAIRIDYQRRELMIDECQHHGFFDRDQNRPREQGGLRCTRALTGQLIEFSDDHVLVQTRQGTEQQVGLRPLSGEDGARLALTLDGQSVMLVPGQTNDLNQSIERLAHMIEERDLLSQFMLQSEQQQRALMAQSQMNDVPKFTLPASVIEEHNAARAADTERERLSGLKGKTD